MAGVAQPEERAQLEQAFARLAATGVQYVRWFLFCDGRAGIRVQRGRPSAGARRLRVQRCRRRPRDREPPRHPDHVRAARFPMVRPGQRHARRADGRPRARARRRREPRRASRRWRCVRFSSATPRSRKFSPGTSSTNLNGSRRSTPSISGRFSSKASAWFTRARAIPPLWARPACAGAIDTQASDWISIRCTGTTA